MIEPCEDNRDENGTFQFYDQKDKRRKFLSRFFENALAGFFLSLLISQKIVIRKNMRNL